MDEAEILDRHSEMEAGTGRVNKLVDRVDRSARDWYKDAIIYQLHIKAFFDSNGDGIGDFGG
jgi:maltose alpha-D-glucosyltransferase/alpha-amylase